MRPKHAYQRTRPERHDYNPRLPRAGSLSSGRYVRPTSLTAIFLFLVLLVGSAACLTGCSKGYPPVIVNGYKAEVQIRVFFNEGDPQTYALPAGSHLFQSRPDLVLLRLEVIRDPAGTSVPYTKEILDEARNKAVDKFEVRILSSAGLELRGEDALKDLTR